MLSRNEHGKRFYVISVPVNATVIVDRPAYGT